jgi:hypothetical protein
MARARHSVDLPARRGRLSPYGLKASVSTVGQIVGLTTADVPVRAVSDGNVDARMKTIQGNDRVQRMTPVVPQHVERFAAIVIVDCDECMARVVITKRCRSVPATWDCHAVGSCPVSENRCT